MKMTALGGCPSGRHLKTTNRIESTFATARLRIKVTKESR